MIGPLEALMFTGMAMVLGWCAWRVLRGLVAPKRNRWAREGWRDVR